MDRFIGEIGENFQAQDIDKTNKFAMIGLGKLTSAILGDGPFINDLTCVPASPATLHVTLNPGEVYQLGDTDESGYGPLDPDDHPLVKQGILLDPQDFVFTPPVTSGYSVNYLIQVQQRDQDVDNETRNFYQAASEVVSTRRQSQLYAESKAGTPATTGTQVTPTPDAGFIGAWVVTVANGQTQIETGDIAVYPDAPFLLEKLADKISEATGDARYAFKSAGVPTGAGFPYEGAICPADYLFQDQSAVSRTTFSALMAAITVPSTGNTTNGSPSIVGLSSAADLTKVLQAGMPIEGTNIPSGTTIISVDSPTSITISNNATATGTGVSLVFFPHGNGNGTTTFNVPMKYDLFVMGAGGTYKLAQQGGAPSVALSAANNGPHAHGWGGGIVIAGDPSNPTTVTLSDTSTNGNTTGSSGSGTPFSIIPPFSASFWIIKT